MAKKSKTEKSDDNKRRQHKKRIYTVNSCLPFMNHRFKKYNLTSLQFMVRGSEIKEDFIQPDLHFSKKIRELKNKDWDKIKENVMEKFGPEQAQKRKYEKNCIYDIHGSKLTAKQKQAVEFEQTILEQRYVKGYDIQHFKLLYGKNKLPRIKRIIMKDFIRKPDEPIVIVNKDIKVRDIHITEIKKIVSDENFYGGIKKIQSILAEHQDPLVRIDLSAPTIRKILRKVNYFYKNLKVVHRTSNKKPGPTIKQKKHLSRIIFY